ncbi:hypothetical protein [Streptomyces capillispiralis]|nr:hypothetical protein [Streptomyces capillispiralis]
MGVRGHVCEHSAYVRPAARGRGVASAPSEALIAATEGVPSRSVP